MNHLNYLKIVFIEDQEKNNKSVRYSKISITYNYIAIWLKQEEDLRVTRRKDKIYNLIPLALSHPFMLDDQLTAGVQVPVEIEKHYSSFCAWLRFKLKHYIYSAHCSL